MANDMFSNLDKLGLGMLSGLDVYDVEEKQEAAVEEKVAAKLVDEADYLFDKAYKCPVCDSEFKTKIVKTGKAKLLGIEHDLRPKYQELDTIKYDAVVCTKCGYAALTRYFNHISDVQVKLIKEKIAPNFKGVDTNCTSYSYDEAITRHQLALANSVVKKSKTSERAYICLKLAWLHRGKGENLMKGFGKDDAKVKECIAIEKQYMAKAYEGFLTAMYKENFPIAGMDEWTFTYLVADLAAECEDYTKAMKFLSDIIVSKAATAKLKDKARLLRKEIQDKA